MNLDPRLLDILACPSCKGDLYADETTLECPTCKLVFPVIDDIPVLLVDEASPLVETPAE